MSPDHDERPPFPRPPRAPTSGAAGERDAPPGASVVPQPSPAVTPPAPAKRSEEPAQARQAVGAPAPTPSYTRYRAGRLRGLRGGGLGGLREGGPSSPGKGWRARLRPRRVLAGLLALLVGWVALSVLLLLISAQFEQSRPSADVASVLDGGGYPLVSATNVLVLGSDQRTKRTHEPGASTSGPSRSDVMMLIRTGGGHAAKLSIPRDTVVDIPGHGRQKINAAYAVGGPALAIQTVKGLLGVPINHLVEVNFDNFPKLVDAMGGVDYTVGCVLSRINGGTRNGGYTLNLTKGTHRLDGKQALALARTRHNLCNPRESDLTRIQHQQVLVAQMKSRLASPAGLTRLPWVSWDAPQAIRSDMGGPTLLGLFGALAVGGTPATRFLRPSGPATLPDGEVGLRVSPGEIRTEVKRFLSG